MPLLFLFLALLVGAQAAQARSANDFPNNEPPAAPGMRTTPPVILGVPADTTVMDICSMPPKDSLLVLDMEDGPLPKAFPVDMPDPATIDPCVGGVVLRIWEATDSDMNVTRDTQEITILPDTQAPNFGAIDPLDAVMACEPAMDTGYVSWKNSIQLILGSNISDCSGVANFGPTAPIPSSFPEPCDTLLVTFAYDDACGNPGTLDITFVTIDTTPPILLGLPADTVRIGCDTVALYLANNPPSMVSIQDCQPGLVAAYTQDSIPVTSLCDDREYNIRRTWTVSDSCGNMTTSVHIVEVRDERAPSFTVPPDTTISCGQDALDLSITGTVTDTIDLCGGPITVFFSDNIVDDNDGCPHTYQIKRSWQVRDLCGNTSIREQAITVIDTIPPTFVVPADTTVNCGQENDLMITGVPTMLMDNCDDSLSYSMGPETIIPGLCQYEFIIERAWAVTDSCGNETQLIQRITVIDTIAPVLGAQATDKVITCMAGMDIAQEFSNWINSHGGATASDNCALDDELEWKAYKAGTDTLVSMPALVCPAPSDTIVMQAVDFVVLDRCGNADTTSAIFIVIDNTPPAIMQCPEDIVVASDPAQCEALFTLLPPLVEEECAASLLTESIDRMATLTSGAAPGQEGVTPVDPVYLEFTVANPLPVNAAGDATLTIILRNADAEGMTEYFRVLGEDGSLLGRTGRSLAQCSDSDTTLTIPAAKINTWALDGAVSISLVPNIQPTLSGSFAVNDICSPDSRVEANLAFQVRDFAQLHYQYRINNGAAVSVSPVGPTDVPLPLGENTITYYVSDCAGNQDSCTYKVTVEDREPPILDCPSDISVGLDPGSCTSMVSLPFPEGVTDNCGVAGTYEVSMPLDTASAWLTFTEDPNLNDFVANAKTYTFQNVAANAVGVVTLTLDIRGDFSSNGAFVRVFGDSGALVGGTPVGAAACGSAGQVSLPILADTFNVWAADGVVEFLIEPNPIQVPPGLPGDGINPCGMGVVNADGEVDSISYIFATLSYREITPYYFATGATSIAYTQMAPPAITPTHEFNVGETVVSYVTADDQGNQDTCSFSVFVIDNEPPVALCQATIVEINPSGLEVDTVSVMEFDAGSYDNCLIDTMFLSPNTFTCEQAGTTVMATLTVVDGSGNTSTCTKPIRIEAEPPAPTFSPGICGGDTLYLFANPPVAQGGVVYTYRWYNPNGLLISTQQNPVIPNVSAGNAGAYVLQITGLTGCVAEEVVNVTITNLPLTPAINTSLNVCNDDDIVMNASVTLNNAIYRWYRGLPPGNLVATTNVPQYVVPGPHQPGTQQYYLTIEANGCVSEPSLPVAINVTNRPVAIVNDDEITQCEGAPILLGTFVTGVTYLWTGPSGFSSTSQFPTVIDESTLANAGVYQLVVTKNGCSSQPDFTVVNLLPKPQTPVLTIESGVAGICEGETLILKTLPTGASTYHWVRPNLSEFTTTTNLFLLPNATNDYEGPWYVYTKKFGCDSDPSNTVNVVINEVPEAMVSADPPEVCVNTQLKLFASPTLANATYQWTGPNGYTSVAQNPVINNVTMDHQGTYKVKVKTQQGCMDTASMYVTVLPSVNIAAISNDAPACLDGPTDINLQATLFPPDDGSYTYQWTGPGAYMSIDSVAVIPNATAANNGNYQLVVFTGDGCRSAPAATLVNTRNAPATPPMPVLDATTMPPFCTGDDIILSINPYSGNGITYNWVTPGGMVMTSMERLSLSNLSTDDSGPYRVFVTLNGCNSDTSAMLPVTINPIPTAVATSNSPVCEGEALQLFGSAPAGSAYQWVGPFTSSLQNPVIAAADPMLHSGTYTLVAMRNGCTSAPTSVNVVVNEKPNTPLVSNSGPVCISTPGTALALSVSPASATSGASYVWYYNGDTVGVTQSLNYLLSDFTGFPGGQYTFSVEANLNDCISDPSLPTTATLSTIPDEDAFAGLDTAFCIGDVAELAGNPPALSTGQWAQAGGDTAGVEILEPQAPATAVEGLLGGNTYAFSWSLSSGACVNFSVDTVFVQIKVPEGAGAGDDQLLCAGDTIRLAAANPVQGMGEWSQSDVQADFNIVIDDELDPATTISGAGVAPGNIYVFTWTVHSECGIREDDVFITISDNDPYAGLDQLFCNDDGDAELSAKEPAEGSFGRWSSPDGAILFSSRDSMRTAVSNLKVGDNIFIWTLDDGYCGASSRDTVVVNYQENPVAANDIASIEFAVETEVNVLANDDIPPNSYITILDGPQHGTARVTGDSTFSYLPDVNFIGEDRLAYEVCSDGCECSTAQVKLFVGEDAQCIAPNIITPNGDGINDVFTIPCLLNVGDFPHSQVLIFNRWGDEVFRSTQPYHNNWDGTFNGEGLPADTYFYIIYFGEGHPPANGYLLIQR